MKLNNTRIATVALVFINLLFITPLPIGRHTAGELLAAFFGGLLGLLIVIYILQRLALKIVNKKEIGERTNREFLALNYAIIAYWSFRIVASAFK